jgi:hypothetical protein
MELREEIFINDSIGCSSLVMLRTRAKMKLEKANSTYRAAATSIQSQVVVNAGSSYVAYLHLTISSWKEHLR